MNWLADVSRSADNGMFALRMTKDEAEAWFEELKKNKEKRGGFWQSLVFEALNDYLVTYHPDYKKED